MNHLSTEYQVAAKFSRSFPTRLHIRETRLGSMSTEKSSKSALSKNWGMRLRTCNISLNEKQATVVYPQIDATEYF